jgi:hypothetical protein
MKNLIGKQLQQSARVALIPKYEKILQKQRVNLEGLLLPAVKVIISRTNKRKKRAIRFLPGILRTLAPMMSDNTNSSCRNGMSLR